MALRDFLDHTGFCYVQDFCVCSSGDTNFVDICHSFSALTLLVRHGVLIPCL